MSIVLDSAEATEPQLGHRRAVVLIVVSAALLGAGAAIYYARAGLTLTHYDARAHLVVARRILDSLMPGWQQIGAVWLPLPHVLNMLPVQVDSWYQTGASAIAISVASMALAAGALAWFVLARTGLVAGAAAGGAVLMVNPSVLYLQSTPMTEPLLFGTTLLAIALTADWLDRGAPSQARAPGLAIAAACMTRYEAWPICGALIVLVLAVLVRRGSSLTHAAVSVLRLAAYPAVALALFLLNSRWTVGSWFVSGGFFVAENDALGAPMVAWDQVREGLYRISGPISVWPAYLSIVIVIGAFVWSRRLASVLLVLALGAAAALPCYAYLQGHPFRIRYSVPLVAACAALIGTGIGLLPRRLQAAAAVTLVAATVWQLSPFDRTSPLLTESQRDAQNLLGRQAVTEYLARHHDGRPIMMSMGSLAHYMHDLSALGLEIHDFLHEGNGEVWKAAVQYGPRAYVDWVAIEETSEGGDALYYRAKEYERFLAGFDRVAEGGGVALYRRLP